MVRNAQAKRQVAKDVDPEVFALIFMGAMRNAVVEWRSEGCASDLLSKAAPSIHIWFASCKRADRVVSNRGCISTLCCIPKREKK